MSNLFTLRVDVVDGVTRDRVVALVSASGIEDACVVHEFASVTGKPHFQGWVRTNLGEEAWRKRVKAAFPECVGKARGGAALYSAAKVKLFDDYHRYIMKGTDDSVPDLVYSSTQIDIREAWLDAKAKAAQRAAAAAASCKSTHEKWIVDAAVEYVEGMSDYFGGYSFAQRPERYKQEFVCEWIIKELLLRRKTLDDFILRKYINTALARLSNESTQHIVQRICDKL